MYTYLQKYKGYTSGSQYKLAPVCREKMSDSLLCFEVQVLKKNQLKFRFCFDISAVQKAASVSTAHTVYYVLRIHIVSVTKYQKACFLF